MVWHPLLLLCCCGCCRRSPMPPTRTWHTTSPHVRCTSNPLALCAVQVVPEKRPVGAFGQRYPQNVPVAGADSQAVKRLGVQPLQQHADSERLGPDGLPHVGAIVWPGQVGRGVGQFGG